MHKTIKTKAQATPKASCRRTTAYAISFFFFFIILFISGCTGPSLLCKGFLQLWCSGFSLLWLLLLQSSGSELRLNSCGAPSLSCSEACGIFPDQESNLCPLCWQAGSFPLCYQGSPRNQFYTEQRLFVNLQREGPKDDDESFCDVAFLITEPCACLLAF